MSDVLERFTAPTREWFRGAFREPTPAQAGAWDAISAGGHALVVAPTGSGKTLSAFLWSLDRLASAPRPADAKRRTRVLYISPLKALGVDVERNLRSPLVGITQTAKRLGIDVPPITVGVRSGDTPADERRLLLRDPPDILITTPESLFLLLTSAARETLVGVETVILDEVHAVAATKRGAHLAVSLERLDALLPTPAQRIGLSATVRPREEVARFLGGAQPVAIVAPPITKTFDLRVVVPVEDMTELGVRAASGDVSLDDDGGEETGLQSAGSIWPHVDAAILEQILEHRSTIVFANSRRLAERLTARLNELHEERVGGVAPDRFPAEAVGGSGVTRGSQRVEEAAAGRRLETPTSTVTDPGFETAPPAPSPPTERVIARAHHGSVSKEQRANIEDDLKSGRLRCVVATSSLELGIDMGAVDLVIQVESPPSVASGLQRVGRAGHQVGEISQGVLFPKHRADLLHTTVATERMTRGLIEELRVPQNPLDVLAQQTVAAVALEQPGGGALGVEDWYDTVRRSAPFATLPRSAYEATLDLLAGRYPSDEFAELRPRIVWDRVAGTITGRPGAQRLAVTSGGTIPDRGMFGVFIVGSDEGSGGGGRRVGELDEEMVYESRVGDVFALGATSWRIEEITSDRVLVSPAFGQPGRVPFWKGDGLGRPAELGRAIGAFTAELAAEKGPRAAGAAAGAARESGMQERLEQAGLDAWAIDNLRAFVREQQEATGTVPTDRTLLVERFRDELGDWRLVLHSPYGTPVHAPWALAVTARIRERLGVEGSAMAADDGIVVRLPDTDADPPGPELFVFEKDELDQLVTQEVGGSALFASRFRESAARALLLPRRNPGRRSPLWQQRQRSAQLLEVARKYPSFPIILETVREVLQDAYDLPSLMELTAGIAGREVRLVEVETASPSPFARTLLFGYVAAFMYEGDSPLAERRAAALSLDPALLAELLGRAELRELLDPKVIAETEAELQRLAPDRRARDTEGLVNLLRMLGPLSTDELIARYSSDGMEVAPALERLARENRVIPASIRGADRWAVVEDAARLRDALGVPIPHGVPSAFLDPVADPIGDLVSRYARTHGPFTLDEAAERLGLGVAVVQDALRRLAADRRVSEGEFRPGATGTEWVDQEVLRRLRARSLAALRSDVEPVPADALARFLPAWQHIGAVSGRTGGLSRVEMPQLGHFGGAEGAFATSRSGGGPGLRGIDGLVQVIDQLAGARMPASAWESLVLPSRVRDYSPAWLDELTTTGEVVWSGAGELSGGDGWIALHLADSAPLTLAEPGAVDRTELHDRIQEVLVMGGGYFFRQLAQAVGPVSIGGAPPAAPDDAELARALWELVWAGIVTGDSLAPLRARLGGTTTSRRAAPRARGARTARSRYAAARHAAAAVAASAPPTVAGRWSLLPAPEADPTVRATAMAEQLLERHGVVTRGAVQAEGIEGGFGAAYRVLAKLEETGRVRRGYFVERLGAAQFATPATVDRLRTFVTDREDETPPTAVTLAAADPANPFGAALGWPEGITSHRPGRKAGALVVLVEGRLALYSERGGKTMLTFDGIAADDPDRAEALLASAAESLAGTVRATGGALRVEKIDGEFAVGTRVGDALARAGFAATPQGLRLRG